MSYDIVIGRDNSDKEKFGTNGLVYIGKGYVKMGNYTSLSNKIWMDVARSHVILIAGKRGSGKSYTLGAIAEELANLPQETSQNIASLIFDTMGIFWTMKFPNEKDKPLLKEWDLETKSLPVKVFVPFGKSDEYKSKGIPFDSTFALKASELEAEDWITIFNLSFTQSSSIIIERVVTELKDSKRDFSISDILNKISLEHKSNQDARELALALFKAADTWGIFSKTTQGTEIVDLTTPGTSTILDVSVYNATSAFNIRALVISIITKKLFNHRMDARKKEELDSLAHGQDYLSYSSKKQEPLVWLFIDEAHEFLPREGKTPASDALIQVLREGRQPGLSLVLATQQPGQIHRDVMTQSDIVISHRVTAKPDIDSLNDIMQSYMLEHIKKHLSNLPALKGSAIILDDNSERIYPIRVRPRFTWHGGEAPVAVKANSEG